MLTAFLTVGQQVLILFFFLAIGFVCGKTKLIDDKSSLAISNLVLYTGIPAAMIVSFQGEFVTEKIWIFFAVIILTFVLHGIHYILAKLLIREKKADRCCCLQFAAVLPNSCFMGVPLMAAAVGSIGVMYGSAYVAASIFLIWTLGVYMISGDRQKFSLRVAILNPGVLGVVFAMILYLTQIKVPPVLFKALSSLASLNTPLPMMVIGYQLSKANIGTLFRHGGFWVSTLLRLIILPLISLALVLLLPIPGEAAVAIVIASATPSAVVLGMFAVKYGKETDFAAGITATQTLISIITIPIIVGIAQYLIP
ncbi:MAG: AEC family transporter [Oscillospiraceae bacterium]|nr:AEC family transporter [Oscillibacter sp.]MBQ3548260.1 AEC family transporter [Oscillospiraceae bacterium]